MTEIRGIGVELRSPAQERRDLTNPLDYQESPNLEQDLRNGHLEQIPTGFTVKIG